MMEQWSVGLQAGWHLPRVLPNSWRLVVFFKHTPGFSVNLWPAAFTGINVAFRFTHYSPVCVCVCVMIISAHSASWDVSELSLLWCTTALHYGCLSFCHLWDLSDLLIASFQRSAEQNQELKPVAPSASPVAVCIHVIEVNSRAVCVQLTHTGIVNWLNSVQTKFFGLFLQ